VPNATTRSHEGKDPFLSKQENHTYFESDLLVRHERLTHRKDRDTQKENVRSSTEPSYVPEEEHSRKRMRASCDASRPVPEIPGMMSSPAVFEIQPSHYATATSFSPMTGAHSNSYSLTALSMAAEYQALQGNIANGNSAHHGVQTPSTLPSVTIDVTLDGSQAIMPASPIMNARGPTLEESLDSLASFLDNEPLNSYHFATLMSAEQPM
jgi:hypothetical protein